MWPQLSWGCPLQDAKVVDNACLALSRTAEAFAHRPASLNMLCEFGLITNAVQLVSAFSSVGAPMYLCIKFMCSVEV